MKLHSSIARLIRLYGYAAVLTIAVGCSQSVFAANSTTIEFLTEEAGIPSSVARKTQYDFKLNVSRPDTSGLTPWGTREGSNNIIEQVTNGQASIKGWCPWRKDSGGRPGHNYEVFIPNLKEGAQYTSAVTSNSTTWYSYALRPDIQKVLPGIDETKVQEISYVGARSLHAAASDSSSHYYYAINEGETVYTQNGRPVNNKFKPVYGPDNKQLTNEQGQLLYTDRTSNQYYRKVYANDEDMQGTLVELPALKGLSSANIGDTTKGLGRSEIVYTQTPINVHNNTLIIELSGFALAMGAYSHYGDVYDNLTYIQDVRVSDDIFSASTHNGDSYRNSLVVVRAQAIGENTTLADEMAGVTSDNFNNGGKMYSVYSVSKSTNNAHDNTAFVYGSTTYQSVGGAVAGGEVRNNSVIISHSDIAVSANPVYVGNIAGGESSGTGKSVGNLVVVDDTLRAEDIGIEPERPDQTVAGGWTSSVPEVSTIHSDIYGGATNGANNASNAENNRVIILGATAADGSTRTSIESNIFGGLTYNSDDKFAQPTQAASANGNTVVLVGAETKASAHVPILRARRVDEDNVWGDKTTRTDVGRICGGYASAPTDTNTAPGHANNNTVIILDSKVANSVYGGSNEGNGQANGNELHLSHVDTTGTDGTSFQDRTFYGGWINSYKDGGEANNNHVWLYDTGWSMDKTFLHGGHGREMLRDSDGFILGRDNKPLIKGAVDFDGSSFYDASGAVLATVRLSRVIVHGENGSVTTVFDKTTAFDGATFFNSSRMYAGSFEQMSLLVPKAWDSNGKVTSGTDILSEAATISEVKADGSIDFYADDDAKSVVATYSPQTGKILRKDGTSLNLAPIARFNPDTGAFEDAKGNVLCMVARGTIVNGTTVYAHGITRYELNDTSGDLQFLDADGNIVATFQSTTIIGKDSDGNEVNIDVPDSEVDKNGIHMIKQGNLNDVFAALSGQNEYLTYTRGNWLHLAEWQGKLKGFDHFEKLSFVITKDIDRSKAVITITGNPEDTGLTFVNEKGEAAAITVEADISEIVDELQTGDIIPLFGHEENKKIPGTNQIDKDVVDDSKTYRRGVTRTFTLDTEFKEWNDPDSPFYNYGVIEVVTRTDSVTSEAKSLVEGRIATLTLNNMGADLIATQGIDAACAAAGTPDGQNDYVPVAMKGKDEPVYATRDELEPGNRLFFAASGSHTKVDSGSNVDVDGMNALVGISRSILRKKALTMGIFMETGWGKYHTNNYFTDGAYVPHVRGTGETSYVGGGVLLRYRLEHLEALSGFSVDATLRAGSQDTDYATPDLVDDNGRYAEYELSNSYIAGHAGLNYTFHPMDKLTTLLYARYLWSRIGGDHALICGESVSFGDASSNRLQVGTRVSWQLNDNWIPFAGAAFQWEFSGIPHATTYGLNITAPSMRGGSVLGEIGTIWQPSVTTPLWIEAALQGSLGKNENYGARLGVSIGF